MVINRLHRRKFDANRDRTEAAGGHAPLDAMWRLFHTRIDSAKARAARVHPSALLLDLHGHGHAIPRLELGYLLSASSLRLSDALLAPLLATSSVAALDAGNLSGQEYFDGGYNTQRHGSRTAGPVDAIQLECFNAGLRDTAANRTAFAEGLVTALLVYLADHYGWVPG